MKKKIFLLIIISIVLKSCNISPKNIISLNFIKNSYYIKENQENIYYSTPPKSETINIISVGDIMVHKPQLTAQYNEKLDLYDFTNNFMYVKKYIYFSDLALCNLETTLCGKESGYSGYPAFNSPDELLDAIKDCGFDVVTTINNHTADKGYKGITRTLKLIKEKGLVASGTKNNNTDKNYVIEYVKNIKIGILSYSYGEIINGEKRLNSIPIPKNLSENVNIFNHRDFQGTVSLLKKDISLIKEEKIDVIILVLHWGVEYSIIPNDFQKKLAQEMSNEGVNIIFGSHPHVIQPIEFLKSEIDTTHKMLVCYSLGNYLSNQRKKTGLSSFTEDGIIVNVKLKKENNIVNIENVTYIPTWVNKYTFEGKNKYEIIPIIKEDIENIKNIPLEDLERSYQNTTSIITNKEIKLYKE